MIRPTTVLTFILACGSGMYLYQAKHHVQLIDQQIDRAVKQTEILRGQSRALHAEWMLLNDPDRLHRLADRYLPNLQPVAPTQFTDLADLDSRLPPVGPPPPAEAGAVIASAATAAPTPGQSATGASTENQAATDASGQTKAGGTDHASSDQATVDAATTPPAAASAAPPAGAGAAPAAAEAPPMEHTPRPPIAQARPAYRAPRPAIAEARSADHAPRPAIVQAPHMAARAVDISPARTEPFVAAVRTPQHVPVWKPPARHPVMAEAAPRRLVAAVRRPMPAMRPPTAPQPAYGGYGGSMLGMARGMSSVPRPVPVNAAYSNVNSGG